MLDAFTWFKQSGYLWQDGGPAVYIDPWEATTDVPADVILITHAHFDHFSVDDLTKLTSATTRVIAPRDVADELSGNVTAVGPGESHEAAGIKLETVPAYNNVEARLEAHPRSNNWVGYVLSLGGHTYYHAGDTDHLPELEDIRSDVAFLPIGGTYTMDANEAAGLARKMSPRVAVPMHYGFVVGSPADGQRFAEAAAPVPVTLMTPQHPFELE
ncbi:MAG: MBL fold metallo-hydrolase [Acidimicrobiales bacterium]